MNTHSSFFLAGGAGFIGSHFIDALLLLPQTQKVTIYDNFSNGQSWHYQHHLKDARLKVIRGDIHDLNTLCNAIENHDVVFHFAANADISKAFKEPAIDFTQGVLLTHQILEAMRIKGIARLIFFSGSGVYGELGDKICFEDQGKLEPISPYGASKLSGEAFISSYSHMFNINASIFRFANVVGPRQTHGVAYDFIRQLEKNPQQLRVLGDGYQTKSYVHVHDIVRAVLMVNNIQKTNFDIYNVASDDTITVRQIAHAVVDALDLTHEVEIVYTGGDRGWPGDVPKILLDSQKIKKLGWCPHFSSLAAIKSACASMIHEFRTFSYDEL
ncbi:MAG: NAD-dependent epimerase/dehydratase family protein [Gammaproteobacteria bacterium]|nr:NAD-dependent epimerase/dehydratase family protein [Gammaproteobacteria bacterium]